MPASNRPRCSKSITPRPMRAGCALGSCSSAMALYSSSLEVIQDMMQGMAKSNAERSRVAEIEAVVQHIVRRFSPHQVILFGSHARGDAGPDSDVDLLVVMPVQGSKREKQIEIRIALHDFGVPLDLVVVTPEEVARKKDVVGTIVRPALREGRVLYTKAA